jgi:flavodoxin
MKKLIISSAVVLISGFISSVTEELHAADSAKKGKVLIAYFSMSGNTRVLANQIKDMTGGELFEIVTVQTYPSDYNALVNLAKKEQAAGYLPELKSKVNKMNSYDVVFIGYPNWWGTMPMPVFNFLKSYDFKGKTIIPFCTNEGSGMGSSENDIRKICPSAVVKNGLPIRGGKVKSAQNDVRSWLRASGYVK